MKVLTTNFVQCAVRDCAKAGKAYPLHFSNCELAQQEAEFNPEFIINILPKIEWSVLVQTANELGNPNLPTTKPEIDIASAENEDTLRLLKDLHNLLVETHIITGAMTCNNCQHVYQINNSIANFLLPPHLTNNGVPE